MRVWCIYNIYKLVKYNEDLSSVIDNRYNNWVEPKIFIINYITITTQPNPFRVQDDIAR
jgi:hypothetical protein